MGVRYVVPLTKEERELLKALVSKGRASARKIGHARVLLKVDADGPNWTETVRRTLKKRVEAAHEGVLVHSPRAERGVRRRDGRCAQAV